MSPGHWTVTPFVGIGFSGDLDSATGALGAAAGYVSRKAVRGLYNAFHGDDSLRNPTADEWAAFTVSCNLRDMGTHLCALPTGEHCPKGLVCLGCTHAQPKQSAAPIFRRMLVSHERALGTAREHGEPAGQIAARQLEVSRISHALRRAEDLPSDVAAAIEAEAGCC